MGMLGVSEKKDLLKTFSDEMGKNFKTHLVVSLTILYIAGRFVCEHDVVIGFPKTMRINFPSVPERACAAHQKYSIPTWPKRVGGGEELDGNFWKMNFYGKYRRYTNTADVREWR